MWKWQVERKRYELSEDDDVKPTFRERLVAWLQTAQFTLYTTLILLMIAVTFLWPRMFVSVPSGSNAVMYRYFLGGTVTDRIWGEGLNVIPPWDKLTIYETRMQQQTITFDVLSEEGLDLGVAISVRYRPNKEMLGYLHQDIGTEYLERLIRPEVESHVRYTFGNRPAHEIYSSARDVLQELGKVSTLGRLEEDGTAGAYVHILELKLIDIELPANVQNAIAEKYRQEQLMLEYRYKLEREEREAERMRTEAAGIRDYNLIANKISPDLLRWRSIEASLELARSQNTKVVVLGGGQGAQMLFNVDSGMQAPPAAPVPPPAREPEDKNRPVAIGPPPPPGAEAVPAPTPESQGAPAGAPAAATPPQP
ncbi:MULTISPECIES: prohibitin family protein [Sorangium]|uniref:prohibitin family protein n=1 Tax=Sorangium TaxID=39643 RepID=UPI003D9C05E7